MAMECKRPALESYRTPQNLPPQTPPTPKILPGVFPPELNFVVLNCGGRPSSGFRIEVGGKQADFGRRY